MRLRALTALLALGLALAVGAAGCGDDGEPATTPTEPTTAAGPAGGETITSEQGGLAGEDTTTTPEQTTVPEQGAGEVGAQRSPADDEAAIKETLASVLLVSADPAETCDELLTKAYVQRSYGSAQGCRAAQDKHSAPEVVTFESFDIGSDRARGVIRFQGGVYDGEKGDVELVLEDGRWKLEALRVNAPPGP